MHITAEYSASIYFIEGRMPFVVCFDSVIDAVSVNQTAAQNGKPHLQDRADGVFPSQANGCGCTHKSTFSNNSAAAVAGWRASIQNRTAYEEHERAAGESELRPVQAYTS